MKLDICRFFPVLLAAAAVSATAAEVKMSENIYAAEGADLLRGASKDLVVSAGTAPVVKLNEKVVFTIDPAAPPANAAKIRILPFVNGIAQKKMTFPLKKSTVTMSSAAPAHLMVKALYLDAAGRILAAPPRTGGNGDGVFVAPDDLRAARAIPADFREFWERQVKKLRDIPMQVSRKKVDGNRVWQCEDVEINSIADIPVKGYLVMPNDPAPRSLPAIIYFHGAGFKSAVKRTAFGDRAIVFDINAHGIPNGMGDDYYHRLNRVSRPASRNISSGKNDREKSYFKNMFLRTVRALDFIRTLPEWDGKTLIVFGRSQGGAQALAAAALVKEVTLCVANVPAMADHYGAALDRAPGWPQFNTKLDPAVATAADYVDVVNLASMIKCEVIMSIGMIDTICPPTGIYLAYKNINNGKPKKITLFPRLGHNAPPAAGDGTDRVMEELAP